MSLFLKTSHITAYQTLFFPCNFFSLLTHSQLSFLLPGIDFSLNFHESEKSESVSTQLCPTLCDPMNCSLPGSPVHGILQARMLEWVAISFSRRSSRPRDQTLVSCFAGRFFTIWATRKAHVVEWWYLCTYPEYKIIAIITAQSIMKSLK